MRILVIGANGQLGSTLVRQLAEHDVHGCDLPEIDITDLASVTAQIEAFKPDVVINTAAYTNVDGCAKNPDLALQVNGLGPHNIALACAEFDADLVHISTNEVFPGDNPNGYYEGDQIRPINPYGNSKAAGELYVRSATDNHYIVRPAWFFSAGGKNFVHSILRFAKERGALTVVTDEVGSPTYVEDLAEAIIKLLHTKEYGTYHFTNSGSCSRWEFANEILRLTNQTHIVNEPILSSAFERASTPPPYGVIHNTAGAALGITLRSWQEALAEYIQEHVLTEDNSQ